MGTERGSIDAQGYKGEIYGPSWAWMVPGQGGTSTKKGARKIKG